MAIPRTVPAALGAVAFLPTTALMAMHIVLARSPADRAPAVRATGIVAALLQVVLVVSIPVLSFGHLVGWMPRGRWGRRAWFGLGLGWCVVAAVVSVGNVVCLTEVVDDPRSTILGRKAGSFRVGAAATLGLAFASQFLFFLVHFLNGRPQECHPQISTHPDLGSQSSTRLKPPLAYLKTTRVLSKDFGSMSFDCPTPPASIAERPATGVLGSIRRALQDTFRPITSRTRGMTMRGRSARRPRSIHLSGPLHEARSRSTSDGFDSWDTSAVDPEHRQTVMESSSSAQPNRGLETIPASPPASRSPSPAGALDLLEPPRRTRRRSRSYSPVSTRAIQAQRAAFTMQHASQSEAHIHPLFRSDSPTPPPSATPGTVVVAAPNAGQVISDRVSLRSIQSMRRLRSDSIPAVPSPLSRPGSCKSSLHKRGESGAAEIVPEEDEAAVLAAAVAEAVAEAAEEEEEEGEEDGGETPTAASPTEPVVERERKMTPPIPDWILTAGLRLSLAAYHARKSRTSEGSEEEPPVAAMV